MSVGYIKLHRKLLDWEWKTKPLTFALFVHLLQKASFEDNNWRGISLKAGQLITGRKRLSEETGLSERQVRTALNHLKSTNEVTIKTTKEYSIITIVCWKKYQASDQQNANERPSTDQAPTTTKEGKEGKKVKNITVPDFIEGEVWAKWIKHRTEIKKKLTPTQSQGQIESLTKWHNEGADVNQIILNSVNNGWQGLFNQQTKPNKLENQAKELIGNDW